MDKPHIKLLPQDLINKIAAGEVVERPASIVKELVENSIDAGANHITVEISDAGKKLIRVTDDGCGMSEDEIKLALERHSTSKISSSDDLFNIKTLGFRGEALPSIASISNMSIAQNQSGKGITVTIKDIFYNTPARLKFLKSNYTEISHIEDLMSRFIISHPAISFRFVIDGKEIFLSPGNGKLLDAIFSIYGLEIANNLVEVKENNVSGYISRPVVSRLDRNMQKFFVNQRSINNFLLSRSVEDAYRNLIPGNRYPIAFIFIDISPNEVDVNVHPSKREVKFLKTKEVMDNVRRAVARALGELNVGLGVEAGLNADDGFGSWSKSIALDQLPMTSDNTRILTQTYQPPTIEVSDILPIIPLCQILNTYIICTDGRDLVLVDQHAAHERIIFDKLDNLAQTLEMSQELLIPETIELSSQDFLVISENLELLKSFGFILEGFGRNSFIARSVPIFIVSEKLPDVLSTLASELKDEAKLEADKKKDRINKFIACRGAVKAGDKLESDEMRTLIKDLYKTQNPMTCPHGRPIIIKIGKGELEKLFKRK